MLRRNKNSNFKSKKRNSGKWYTLPLTSLAVAFAMNNDNVSANGLTDDSATTISASQGTGLQTKSENFSNAFAKFNTGNKTNEIIDKLNVEKMQNIKTNKSKIDGSSNYDMSIEKKYTSKKIDQNQRKIDNEIHIARGNEKASSVSVLNNQTIVRGMDDIVDFLKTGSKTKSVNSAGSIGDDGKSIRQVDVYAQDYVASCLNNMMMAARLGVVSENAKMTDDQIKSTVAETLANKKITPSHADYALKQALLESVMKQARSNAAKVEDGSFSKFGLRFTAPGKATTASYKDVDTSNLEIMKNGIVDALLLQGNGGDTLAKKFLSLIRSTEENNAVLNRNISAAKAKVADKEFKEAEKFLKQYEAEQAAITPRKETMQRNIEAAKARSLLKSSNNNLNKQQTEPKSTFKSNANPSLKDRMKMFEGK